MQESEETSEHLGLPCQPFRAELTTDVTDKFDEIDSTVKMGPVPTMCIHESALTKGLRKIGMFDAHCGVPPIELADQTVDAVINHGSLPGVDAGTEMTIVRVPPGKSEILRAISHECQKMNRPLEFRVHSALLSIGAEELLKREQKDGQR